MSVAKEAKVNELDIPDIVIGRLPVYLRTLKQLVNQGREVTSSQELGELLGISSAQIRKDLSHFGEFGKQGEVVQDEVAKVACIDALQARLIFSVDA